RNNLSKSFYGQQSLASNDTSSSDRSLSPESAHDRRSPFLLDRSSKSINNRRSSISKSTNIESPSLIRKSSFEEDYDQQLLASTAINTSSLIGPFKNDLEVCLYLVQHPQLIELVLNMIKAGGSHESITRGKAADKFNTLSEKTSQPTKRQIAEYITEDNWTTFLKRHMDVTDVQKTFEEQRVNVNMFTSFIQSAFNLFVQEELLDKDVINDVKDLNYMTVDMEVFTADGKEALQQINIRDLYNAELAELANLADSQAVLKI
ncbi:39467_t:CDS:2, partial [Gigaspora margarita]